MNLANSGIQENFWKFRTFSNLGKKLGNLGKIKSI